MADATPGFPRFDRLGRGYHLRIETATDLRRVLTLDEAHWVATSAPTDTLHADPAMLRCVDADGDGRIRACELRRAIDWTLTVFRETGGLLRGDGALRVSDIDPDHPDGARIHAAADRVTEPNDPTGDPRLDIPAIRAAMQAERQRAVSEAGVALPEAALNEPRMRFMEDIIRTVGGAAHPTGKQGVGEAQLLAFLAAARGWLQWRDAGRLPDDRSATDIMPLGADTPDAYAAFIAVRDKINQYFAQCRAVRLDPALASRFGPQPGDLARLDLNDPEALRQVMRAAPLAVPTPEAILPPDDRINPAYQDPMRTLRQRVLEPVGQPGDQPLDEPTWRTVERTFAAHEQWLNAKVGTAVAPLGEATLRDYLDPRYADGVRDLIQQSRQAGQRMAGLRLLEQAAMYQRDLMRLVNNFVSFPDLYDPARRALFDAGDLIMDGRRFNLAVPVQQRAEHASVAATSQMYVLYLRITGRDITPYEVACAVTGGGRGNLCVGKRGIFYDVIGRQRDARVVQVIENPISLLEAAVSPFRRLGRAIAGKIENIAAAAETKLDQTGAQVVTEVQTAAAGEPGATGATGTTAAPAGSTPPATSTSPAPGTSVAAPPPRAQMGGVLAGGGIAIAALGSSLAFITKTLAGLSVWTVLAGLLGAVAAVLLPTLLIAWLKLRGRDLSALLEGSGWAINARMRLTGRLARSITHRPAYPPESRGRGRRRLAWVLALLTACLIAAVVWGLRG